MRHTRPEKGSFTQNWLVKLQIMTLAVCLVGRLKWEGAAHKLISQASVLWWFKGGPGGNKQQHSSLLTKELPWVTKLKVYFCLQKDWDKQRHFKAQIFAEYKKNHSRCTPFQCHDLLSNVQFVTLATRGLSIKTKIPHLMASRSSLGVVVFTAKKIYSR